MGISSHCPHMPKGKSLRFPLNFQILDTVVDLGYDHNLVEHPKVGNHIQAFYLRRCSVGSRLERKVKIWFIRIVQTK